MKKKDSEKILFKNCKQQKFNLNVSAHTFQIEKKDILNSVET